MLFRSYFIAYSSGASVFIRDIKELRRFLKIPRSIPMRESLESWLASLANQDAAQKAPKPDGLSDELLATGFGPEVHALDESDPNYNTRTVV